MTYSEAFRQIVDKVNAGQGDTFEYKRLGILGKWTNPTLHDTFVILDSLVMTVQMGAAGKRQRVCTSGEASPADVDRVAQEILDYIRQPVLVH